MALPETADPDSSDFDATKAPAQPADVPEPMDSAGHVEGASDTEMAQQSKVVFVGGARRIGSAKALSTAGSIASVIIGVVVYLSISADSAAQPTRLLSLISVGVAGLSILGAGLSLIALPKKLLKPYDLLPIAGVGFFIAAVVTLLLGDEAALIPALAASSPALAAGAMWIGRLAISSRVEEDGAGCFAPQRGRTPESYQMGGRFSIQPGTRLAVDCRIESGSVGIDETLFSTVPTFRIKDEEEIIPAGSVVLTGSAEVISLSDVEGSSAGQMERAFGPQIRECAQGLLVEDASASRWTTMVLFFGSLFVAIFWSERSVSAVEPLMAGGFVLLHACVLQLSQYLYLRRRMLVDGALKDGVILRGSNVCRQLSLVDTVEVDASRVGSGLLPRVVDFKIVDDRLGREAFCNFILSLLGRAEDPRLVVFGEYVRHQVARVSMERVLDLKEYSEKGICGTLHGVELSVGTEAFLVERGIMVQPSDLESEFESVLSTIYVAIDDDIVAHADFRSDQEDIVSVEEPFQTRDGVTVRVSPGVSRELATSTLLVRGNESEVVSVNAPLQEGRFTPERGALPSTQLVSLSPAVAPILSVIHATKVEARAIERYRMVVGITGVCSVVAAFLGVYWPALSLASIGVAQGVVMLSQSKNS